MRFPLKFALSAVLANTIAAELTHMAQPQQLVNDLDVKYVQQPQTVQQQPQQQQQIQPIFRQAGQMVSEIVRYLKFLYGNNERTTDYKL